MSINKKHIISGVIATSVAIPLYSAISNADCIEYRTITANSVNFRTGPSTSYSSIGKLNKGYKVEYIGISGDWIKIKYNDKTGYVYGEYVGIYNSLNQSSGTKKVVKAKSLNFRSGPGTKYSIIGSLKKGNEVSVISELNGWSKINYGGKTGYVSSSYLVNENESSNSESSDTTEVVKYKKMVNTSGLNFRTGPGTSYSKISTLSYGTEVFVISQSNGWSKISYNSKIGYVSSSYLADKQSSSNGSESSTPSSKADKVISFSKTLLGKKYSWGAEGPNSFDCSGFTYYIFKNNAGITLPRVSKDQSKFGASVSRSNVQKGDLVFFDTEGANNGVVSHVGIYMGDGKFIHASSGKGEVVISDFNSGYYKGAFVNARRVI